MFSTSSIVRAALLITSLAPAARSAIFDVVVGGPNGLKFEPESIVRDRFYFQKMLKGEVTTICRPLFLVTRSALSSGQRTIPPPSRFSKALVPLLLVASILACQYPLSVSPALNISFLYSIEVDPALTEGFPVAELPITTTDGIFVYCKQGNHCNVRQQFLQ